MYSDPEIFTNTLDIENSHGNSNFESIYESTEEKVKKIAYYYLKLILYFPFFLNIIFSKVLEEYNNLLTFLSNEKAKIYTNKIIESVIKVHKEKVDAENLVQAVIL